jgi:alpha-L-fucosidase
LHMSIDGLIFHWGLYSVPAYDHLASMKRRRKWNGAEWYLARLREKGDYRPLSGWKETQEYHREKYGDRDYYSFAEDFTAQEYYPDEWMRLAREWGVTYVILTTKHHDGWCLFETETDPQSRRRRDLVREFCKSARKHGLRVGLYFSLTEFNVGCTQKYLRNVLIPQLRELARYEPDILWLDGGWNVKTQVATREILKVLEEYRAKGVEINDRVSSSIKEYADPNYLGISTFRNYEDRALPREKPRVLWEHVTTLGYSWGRMEDDEYRSVKEIAKTLRRVKELGGRVLMNLGPDGEGRLREEEVERMGEVVRELRE